MNNEPPIDPTQPSPTPADQPGDASVSGASPAQQSSPPPTGNPSPWDVPGSAGGAVTNQTNSWATPPSAPDTVGWASPDASQTPPTPYGSPTPPPPTPYGSAPPMPPNNFAPQQPSQPPTPNGQAPQQFAPQFGQQPQFPPGQFPPQQFSQQQLPPQQFSQQQQFPQQAWGAPAGQFPPGQFPPGQFGAYPGFSTGPQKSKKKVVIIVLVVITLLLGGCGALAFWGYKTTIGKAVDKTNSLFSDLKAENYNSAGAKYCARSQFTGKVSTLQQRADLAEQSVTEELAGATIRSYNFKSVDNTNGNYTVTGTVVAGTRTRSVIVNLIDQDDTVCVLSFSAI